ncbi:MAG TPA: histidine phosphatase family protein [Mycobacteriales bacterium]|jgi:probable phosphomutase (TIGR03848 family)|nr:histidine phosphatase family protein [Mycobacteriales bacterium]
MGTLLLVRHGLTEQTGPVLTGWTPGVHLDDRGREQARALGERLAGLPLAALVSSPLERCQDTAAAIAAGRDLEVQTDERLGECRYGAWTGQEIKKLVKDPLWKVVQAHPSAVTFPEGEALRDTQARALAAVRDWDARLGGEATWCAVSHGDVIKAIAADALGMHLDAFQRITVNPCSLTVIRYTPLRPFVLRLNDSGGSVDDLRPPKGRRRRKASSDAAVGGGAGGSA